MLKVLITAMSLGIGGAETHIMELSGELIRRGHTVMVASAGGVYVPELESLGIRHFSVPMDSRNPLSMMRSYRLLKRIIKTEKPDIIHAHARIPGFICGLLHKKLGFPFVTTCHGVYEVTGLLRRMSDWGQKTLAVSDDIREYLINSYGIPESDIITTVNGIDTTRFSSRPAPDAIRGELGISGGAPVIVHVSRIDEFTTVTSSTLISLMPELSERYAGISLVIAGGGSRFDEINAIAEHMNARLGRRAVIMTGARTDIADIVALADVFVGVSRAALEAMAAEKPVILCGNEGFIGLLDQSVLELARSTNLCCRGCESPSAPLLSAHISRALDSDSGERARLGSFGRELVIKSYSIDKMTDDTLKAYNAVRKKRWSVVMSGYFGFGNAGDEAILQTVHRNITAVSDDIAITVLSSSPEDTSAKYGYHAIDRFHILKVMRALRECDALVSGGGSLLQDQTSTRSLLYYLTIIKAAEHMQKKVMVYANGIGPIKKSRNRRLVRSVLSRADVITLRDPYSLRELRDMGVSRPDMRVTADPVFSMSCVTRDVARRLLTEAGIPDDKPFIGISVRSSKLNSESFRTQAAELCDELYISRGLNIVFIAMQSPEDIVESERIRYLMNCRSYIITPLYASEELMGMIGEARAILAMRLHTLIFAARCAVPVAGIVYDPKVAAYVDALDMPSAGNAEDFRAETALCAVDKLLANHDEYSERLLRISRAYAETAREDAKALLALLEK